MPQNHDPETKIFEVDVGGERLDKLLARSCPGVSRSQIQKLIGAGNVTVNGKPARPSLKLKSGNRVKIVIPPPELSTLIPQDIPFETIYEDADVIVINKPAGLTVHPAPGHHSHTLVNALLSKFPDLRTFGSSPRPGIVHRLDRDTSGLMVIARNERVRQYLINQFKSHSVKKGYLVLVKGSLAPAKGVIEAPIGRDPVNRKRMAVVSSGREARTAYKVLQYLEDYTYLEANIETGRTHQIRVHFSAIGYPIVGDAMYGVKSPILPRQFLHAYSLELRLPCDNQIHVFTSSLPAELKNALQMLRFEV